MYTLCIIYDGIRGPGDALYTHRICIYSDVSYMYACIINVLYMTAWEGQVMQYIHIRICIYCDVSYIYIRIICVLYNIPALCI